MKTSARLTALLLGILILTEPGAPALAQTERQQVKIAYAALTLDFLDAFVAKDREFYQLHGIDADLRLIAPPLQVSALAAGEIDYSLVAPTLILGAMRGAPVRLVQVTLKSPIFYFMSAPAFQTVASLKGKTVGVARHGDFTDLFTRLVLKKHGLDSIKDVTRFSIGGGELRYQALVAGKIHAAVMAPPWSVVAQQQGYHLLARPEDAGELPEVGLGTSVAKIERQRDQVKRVISAHLRALDFIRQERAGTIQIIMKRFNLDEKTAALSYDTILPALSDDGTVNPKGVEAVVTLQQEMENLPKDPLPFTRLADPTLVPEARRELAGAKR
jgi:ABC-type nitrate/sulfonate/bicarbonate transport system substrate-binding protein